MGPGGKKKAPGNFLAMNNLAGARNCAGYIFIETLVRETLRPDSIELQARGEESVK